MLRQSEDPYNMTSEVETLADEIEPEVEDLPVNRNLTER